MRYMLITGLALSSFGLNANVLQYFTGLSYANPAELFKVKKSEFIVGGTNMYVEGKFTGTVLNLNNLNYDYGKSFSSDYSLLPYGRIASRLNKQFVFGIDYTQPFHSNLRWGRTAVTRYASTETLMRDSDLSPRLAIMIHPKLSLGAGLNFNFLNNNEVNWTLPAGPTTYAVLKNPTSGFGVGFNAGFYYLINKSNFFGGVYYGSIKQKTRGRSTFDEFVSDDLQFNFRMPPTTMLNYVHVFSKKWLGALQLFRTEWNVNQYAVVRNTAAQPPISPTFTFPMKYQASLAFSGFVRRQMSEKMGLSLIGLVDDGPEQKRLRVINFPSDKQYFIALIADYQLNKKAAIELLYGHGFSNTTLQNQISLFGPSQPFTTGKVGLDADVVDLRFKMQI